MIPKPVALTPEQMTAAVERATKNASTWAVWNDKRRTRMGKYVKWDGHDLYIDDEFTDYIFPSNGQWFVGHTNVAKFAVKSFPTREAAMQAVEAHYGVVTEEAGDE